MFSVFMEIFLRIIRVTESLATFGYEIQIGCTRFGVVKILFGLSEFLVRKERETMGKSRFYGEPA